MRKIILSIGNKMAIYLDNHATTPVDKRVLKDMLPYFVEHFGNPSSPHLYGDRAKDAVENAREQVAKLINASPDEIYFTASATEANNLVIKDFGAEYTVTSAIEHSSILNSLDGANKIPHRILSVYKDGLVQWDELAPIVKNKQDGLISIMLANNEIGTIQDLKKAVANKGDFLVHTDAAQAIGKIDVDVEELGVDFLSISGHKIYGPKGIGALYCKNKVPTPLIDGGYQSIVSSGTLNVPAIVGLGKACELLENNQKESTQTKSVTQVKNNRTDATSQQPSAIKAVSKETLYPEVRALGQVRSEHPVQLTSEVSGKVLHSGFKLKNGTKNSYFG